MKKVHILVILICLVWKTNAQVQGDKVLHFLGGNLYGLVGAGVASQISKGDRTWTFVGSVGGSLLIGLAKESIDKAQYDGWDNGDLLATVLGGATVGVTIDIFKQRKKKRRAQQFKDAIGDKTSFIPELNKESDITTSLYVLGISSAVLNGNNN